MTGFARVLDDVGKVADAVLFEGYVLYPYRASAHKNQLRWQFGVLTPRDWAERAAESWSSRTECLLEPGSGTDVLHVRLRFLRLRRRTVQRLDGAEWVDTDELTAAGELHLSWDEGLPEVVDADLPLAGLAGEPRVIPVVLPAERTEEPLTEDGRTVGRLVRTSLPLSARVTVATEPVPGPYGALRLRVLVENTGPGADPGRDAALARSLIGAHTVLVLAEGSFLSSADPPEWARPAVRACVNEHTWPVLAGSPERPNVVLSSPIILSDFPEIAPESPNELYDGTENDEILTLRTLALTDAEKREARATDPRAAALVDAVDSMPPEIMERLHGVIRSMSGPTHPAVPMFGEVREALDEGPPELGADGMPTWVDSDGIPTYSTETGGRPWWDPGADASVDPDTDSITIAGHRVAKGTRVLLRPSGRADAQDLFLVGRPAMVQAVLNDVDGDVHLAVSIVDDPAAEFQAAHGRFRYFRPDEVEVDTEGASRVLVAGIGNLLMSDDGFGVEVVRHLTAPDAEPLPAGVEVVDIGIRGMHLAYQLLDGYDHLVLIDAHAGGGRPGELYLLEHSLAEAVDPAEDADPVGVPDAHGMTPDAVLALLASLSTASGADPTAGLRRVLVVGCEPARIDDGIGLSEAVAGSVPRAAKAVRNVVADLLGSTQTTGG